MARPAASDVARRAGVSRKTVSKALNDTGRSVRKRGTESRPPQPICDSERCEAPGWHGLDADLHPSARWGDSHGAVLAARGGLGAPPPLVDIGILVAVMFGAHAMAEVGGLPLPGGDQLVAEA